MIIFKTTFHLDESVHKEGLEYIKNTYIKKATASGVLYMPHLSQILVQYEEAGSSYVLQCRVKDRQSLDKWIKEEGGALEEDLRQKFGDKVCCFVTLLKKINL